MTRAGIRKNGRSANAPRVRTQDFEAMAATMNTTEMTLLTTPESVEVKARWAPMTSLLSRLTRAPVWALVKKAMGCFRTWLNTWVRRSKTVSYTHLTLPTILRV